MWACEECGGVIRDEDHTVSRRLSYNGRRRTRGDKRYCSGACRTRAYRNRQREQPRREELPGQLGLILPTSRPASRSRHRNG